MQFPPKPTLRHLRIFPISTSPLEASEARTGEGEMKSAAGFLRRGQYDESGALYAAALVVVVVVGDVILLLLRWEVKEERCHGENVIGEAVASEVVAVGCEATSFELRHGHWVFQMLTMLK